MTIFGFQLDLSLDWFPRTKSALAVLPFCGWEHPSSRIAVSPYLWVLPSWKMLMGGLLISRTPVGFPHCNGQPCTVLLSEISCDHSVFQQEGDPVSMNTKTYLVRLISATLLSLLFRTWDGYIFPLNWSWNHFRRLIINQEQMSPGLNQKRREV